MSDPSRKIVQARVHLLFEFPFFGHLAMMLKTVEKKTLQPPTMATNGRVLYYHPDFVASLSLEECAGVICHEIYHCMLLHPTRVAGRQPTRWNFACDYAVNDLISKESSYGTHMKLQDSALLDPKYANLAADDIYNKLPPEPKGMTLDSHDEWVEWGSGGEGEDGNGNGNGDKQGKGFGSGLDEEEDAGLEQEWRQAVAQAAVKAKQEGKLPSHLESLIEATLQPKLDWRALITDLITSQAKSDFRLFPPNKKLLYSGIYLPSLTGEAIRIGVAFDTSGSISDQELSYFLGELRGICQTFDDYHIDLIECDARIQKISEIEPFTDDLPTKFHGRGGTDFRPPCKKADELLDITSFVYFTDGYGPFPDEPPRVPVIWVMTTDVVAPFGWTIKYPLQFGEE